MAQAVSVKRRIAQQTMDTVFALEVAIGESAMKPQDNALEPGFLAIVFVQYLGSPLLDLGKSQIHPFQHLRPILGIDATSASVNRQDSAMVVIFFR